MKKNDPPQLSAFPVGNENPPENGQYFIGQSYLELLTPDEATSTAIYNVTFEPSCRNNWHSHAYGQILLVVGGKGIYQEKGKEARELLSGDVVDIAPGVVHWHGAAPESWFSHLAVSPNAIDNKTTWLDPVQDSEYNSIASKD